MLDPVPLFEFEPHIDRRTVRTDTLVVTLGSHDAGHAQRIIDKHLLNTLSNHLIGRFDADQLIDYGAARPRIAFDRDHFNSYQPPAIELHHVSDAHGRSFLLLSGPEPSMQWERVIGTVEWLLGQFDITETVLIHGVPAPTPHTRPIHISRYAGRADLVPLDESVPMAFEMGASFGSLLTLRLGERGHDVTGLVAHIPHYLVTGDMPSAALALLERLGRHVGLELPTGQLPAAAAALQERVAAEVAESEEVQHLVANLEQQYDHYMTSRTLTTGTDIPSADEIGAQIEDFLRQLDNDD